LSTRPRPRNAVLDLARLGEELDCRGGDDAERALTADKELLQIIAGIVLAQPPQPIPDPPVGQYDLEAQGQFAGIAIAQYRDAAGVGRQVAADLAAPLGTKAQREQPVGRGGGLLQIGEDAPGLDRHRKIDRVDRADMIHAAERQNDVVPVLGRDPAANEAGVAALRHDRQFRFGADPHHLGHLRGRSRADDEPGGTPVEAARLDEIGFLVLRVGDPAARTDRRLDPLDGRRDFHIPLLRTLAVRTKRMARASALTSRLLRRCAPRNDSHFEVSLRAHGSALRAARGQAP
jgi:hypothetical protein